MFKLGQIAATPTAINFLHENDVDPRSFLVNQKAD